MLGPGVREPAEKRRIWNGRPDAGVHAATAMGETEMPRYQKTHRDLGAAEGVASTVADVKAPSGFRLVGEGVRRACAVDEAKCAKSSCI